MLVQKISISISPQNLGWLLVSDSYDVWNTDPRSLDPLEIALHVIKSPSWGAHICTKKSFATKTTFCKLCAQHLKSVMKRWTVLTNWWKLENIILLLLFSNLQSCISYCHSLNDKSNITPRCTWSHVYCFFVSRQRNVWFLFFCSRFHAAGWLWSPGGRKAL